MGPPAATAACLIAAGEPLKRRPSDQPAREEAGGAAGLGLARRRGTNIKGGITSLGFIDHGYEVSPPDQLQVE